MAVVINGTTGIDKVQDDSVDIADLSATGSPSSSTYLRGDNTWATAGGATSLDGLSDAAVTASNNIGLGSGAVDSITTGDNNTGVGVNALTANTEGSSNVAMGRESLDANTTGYENTGIGYQALTNNTTAFKNTAVGNKALQSNTTGATNTAVGWEAAKTSTTAENVAAFGYQAAQDNTASNITAIGTNALMENTSGANNAALGHNSLKTNTTGSGNTGLGREALKANTTAADNTAVGYQALTATTTGQHNTAVGKGSLISVTTGSSNVAMGRATGANITTASYQTLIGVEAGYSNATGGSNTLIGYQAGRSLAGDGGAGGVNNVCIGNGAGYDTTAYTGGRWNVVIGDFSRGSGGNAEAEVVIGYNLSSGAENRFTFGKGTNDSAINFGSTSITAPSDERLKENITTATAGLSFINDLRPVTYKWRQEKDIPDTMQAHVADSTTRFCNDKTNHGFVAQEVKTAIDAHSEIKDGFEMWDTDVQDGRQRIADGALVPILVKAIQELSAKNTALEARITTLEG